MCVCVTSNTQRVSSTTAFTALFMDVESDLDVGREQHRLHQSLFIFPPPRRVKSSVLGSQQGRTGVDGDGGGGSILDLT